jgi:hypothetical protein
MWLLLQIFKNFDFYPKSTLILSAPTFFISDPMHT